jgi:hypothetical protein
MKINVNELFDRHSTNPIDYMPISSLLTSLIVQSLKRTLIFVITHLGYLNLHVVSTHDNHNIVESDHAA